MKYELHINRQVHEVEAPPEMPLLWVLRDELGLVGTKFGCGAGLCGACTVHVNGAAQRSCQTPVGTVRNASITTIEHIGETPVGARLQEAWLKVDVMHTDGNPDCRRHARGFEPCCLKPSIGERS